MQASNHGPSFAWLAAVLVAICFSHQVSAQDPGTINEVGLTDAELAELRGYTTISHHVQVDKGYVLDVVEIVNPAITSNNSRGSVIFVHGILSSSGIFLVNSVGAEPKNYANQDPSNMSLAQLQTLLASDGSAKATPLLMSNFNFKVYMMNRRAVGTSLAASGYPGFLVSQKAGGMLLNGIETVVKPFVKYLNGPITATLGSLLEFVPQTLIEGFLNLASALMVPMFQAPTEAGYYEYPIDPQAARDFPIVVDFVRARDGVAKCAVIGHSLGGAIVAMSLAVNPDLNDKLSVPVLWAPAVDGGHGTMPYLYQLALQARQVLKLYSGPVFPYQLIVPLQDFAAFLCQFSFIQNSLCNSLIDTLLGRGAEQLLFNPGYFQNVLDPVGSKEFLQLSQSYTFGSMHFFDYGNDERNLNQYKNKTPPAYDFSHITVKIVIFQGNTDALVTPQDTQFFISQLSGPYDLISINSPKIYCNHLCYMFHRDSVNLVSIPTLQIVSKASASA